MRILTLIVFPLALFLGLSSCSQNSPYPDEKKPTLLVSLAPYQKLVQKVAGSAFTVQTVVPFGANPHAYEPTAKQVAGLAAGTLWFQMGEPFEKKIFPVLQHRNPSLISVDLLAEIDLLEDPSFSCSHCCRDHLDRHVWLSPKLTALQVDTIAKALIDAFPDNRELFEANAKELKEELSLLDRQIKERLPPNKNRSLLVSHPAFGYFCKEYQIEQLSVEFEGKDPRPQHLEEILQKAKTHRADLALALPQHSNKGVKILAERLHLPLKTIDPYSPDYFDTLLLLAEMIAHPEPQP